MLDTVTISLEFITLYIIVDIIIEVVARTGSSSRSGWIVVNTLLGWLVVIIEAFTLTFAPADHVTARSIGLVVERSTWQLAFAQLAERVIFVLDGRSWRDLFLWGWGQERVTTSSAVQEEEEHEDEEDEHNPA